MVFPLLFSLLLTALGQTCPKGCEKCELGPPPVCSSCNPGYFLNASSHLCSACSPTCKTCTPPGDKYSCLTCFQSFYLQYWTGECKPCSPVIHCDAKANITCTSGEGSDCPACMKGYWLFKFEDRHLGDACKECTYISHCASNSSIYCTNSTTSRCGSGCDAGYWKNSTGESDVCSRCTAQKRCLISVTNASCVDVDKLACAKCDAGAYPKKGEGLCIDCLGVKHCSDPSKITCTNANDSKCNSGCTDGYYISANGTVCLDCSPVKECGNVSCTNSSDSKCIGECNPGYWKDSRGPGKPDLCKSCTPVENCPHPVTCESNSTSRCDGRCNRGFWKDTSGVADVCRACTPIPGCKPDAIACSSANDQVCAACQTGYTISHQGSHCHECANGGGNYVCKVGWFKNGSLCSGLTGNDTQTCGECSPIGDCNHTTCTSETNSMCQLCNEEYLPWENKCYALKSLLLKVVLPAGSGLLFIIIVIIIFSWWKSSSSSRGALFAVKNLPKELRKHYLQAIEEGDQWVVPNMEEGGGASLSSSGSSLPPPSPPPPSSSPLLVKELVTEDDKALPMRLFTILDSRHLKINQIYAVYNPRLVSAFAQTFLKFQERLKREKWTFYNESWKNDPDTLEYRTWVMQKLGEMENQFLWNAEAPVRITPVVHGTSLLEAWKVCSRGFATLKSQVGYYGVGIYFASSCKYVLPYFANKEDPTLVISYLLSGNVYPIDYSMRPQPSDHEQGSFSANSLATLATSEIKAGYQSHYAATDALGMPAPLHSEEQVYGEFVIANEAQVCPAYVITLHDTNFDRLLKNFDRQPPLTRQKPNTEHELLVL